MSEQTHGAAKAAGGVEPLDAWFGLGSNVGHRARMLAEAIGALSERPGLELLAKSSVYETDPVGVTDQPTFLNMVARFRCAMAPEELLETVREVERGLKRIRTTRWGPRTIDVDVLLLGALRIET